MKAGELDKGLKVPWGSDPDEDRSYYIPPQRIPAYKAYEKIGKVMERTVHDRGWDEWLSQVTAESINLVTGESVKDQEVKKVIPQVYRTKDPADGKEWLYYNVDLSARNYKGNRKDFSYIEGLTEGVPLFNYEIDPSTQKVISGSTQVEELTREYTIPFTKPKVEEISKWFRNPLSCIVVAQDGRKYSCSLQEFRDMPYDELVNLKIGYTDFMKQRRGTKVYQ